MVKISSWNLGSVAAEVLTLVPEVPSTISGAPLERIADRQRYFMEKYTGQSIGSTGIAEQYQSPLLHLTISETLELMELTGFDAASFTIEEFSVTKGPNSNLITVSNKFRERAMDELQKIGKSCNFYQAIGW